MQAEAPPCTGCSAALGSALLPGNGGDRLFLSPAPQHNPRLVRGRGAVPAGGKLVPHLPLCGAGHRPEQLGAEPRFGGAFPHDLPAAERAGECQGRGARALPSEPERARRDALRARWGTQVGRHLGREEEGLSSAGWGAAGRWPFVRMSDSLLDVSRARFKRTGTSTMPHLRHPNHDPFALVGEVV